ncbi:hypothetical protein DU000_05790 [Parvibium lacunae]|uniref:YncE family protein n=2 Tax=Parvibium lacunae TaxID=1888893 RepID=A0A368L4H5_9BURK|nr:hypothetical protein DU000_05790 [Parvibium lacunae]
MVAVLAACGGGGGGSSSGSSSSSGATASNVFIRDMTSSTIASVVNRNPSVGTLAIDRLLSGAATQLLSYQGDMFMDSPNDRLYVANGSSIVVFNNIGTATGNTAPSRIVANGATGYISVFLDQINNRLYSADISAGIRVFDNASTASLAAPNRQVTGFATGYSLFSLVVDVGRNIAYVLASQPSSPLYVVFVFDGAATMNGVTAPSRTITLSSQNTYGGLAIDAANNRLYVSDAGGVHVYNNASTVNGAAVPAKTITFPVPAIYRIALDTANDRLYATSSTLVYVVNNVSTVSGAVAATQISISGTNLTSIAVR